MKALLGNMAVAQFNAMWKCSDSRSDNSSTRLSGAAASDNTKPATDITSGNMLNNVNQLSYDILVSTRPTAGPEGPTDRYDWIVWKNDLR